MASKPLEIYRGVGTKGGVSGFPLAFSTLQLVLYRNRFPAGFGEKSRQYWSSQFDQAVAAVRKAEADVPASQVVDYSTEVALAFVVSQRDLRVELASKGFYDKQGTPQLYWSRHDLMVALAAAPVPLSRGIPGAVRH
ncbi:MAG: hypothetical protein H7225_04820 [Massilia sp.]|nr:hypothetical protein [Aquabacterium sp.]